MRQSAWAAGAAVTVVAARFALTAVVARRLSTSAFGQFAYGQWFVDIAFLVCSLGATGAASRYFAEYRHDATLLSSIVRRWLPYAIGLPLLTGVIVLLGVRVSEMSLSPGGAATLVVWGIANGAWAMQTAALTGQQRFDKVFLANAIAAGIMLGGAWLMPAPSTNPVQAFGTMAVAAGLAMLVGLGNIPNLIRPQPGSFNAAHWVAVRHYAVNIWLTALLWSLVWSRGEVPIVRRIQGDAGLAQYAAALTLFGGAIQGVMLGVSGVAPRLTELWGRGLRDQAVSLARQVMDVQLLTCGLTSILLISFSREWMHVAFGSSYLNEAPILVILSVALLAMTVSCQSHLLQIATDARFTRNTTLGALAVLLGSAWWLLLSIGLPGAALARTATMLLMAAIVLVEARRRWGAAAYSLRNLLTVSLILVGSACLSLWSPDAPWPIRTVLATLGAGVIVGAVRDGVSQPVGRAIFVRVTGWFVRRPAPEETRD